MPSPCGWPGWRAPVPVICCGNATAGGAGKTTLALDLGQRLARRGVALHYLKAAADMGVAQAKADGRAAVARMKAMPTDDDAFGQGRIREDGRKIHPSYLFEVKAPNESRGTWDYLKVVATTPAEEAFRPLGEGGCPLVRS